ncbi:MAG TPA: pyridoxamine 5'-phosphate oxidase family protein [Nitrospiria bacterium]
MAKTFEQIDGKLAAWIKEQKVFFVATAPAGREGHVNCSPKGGDSFRILDPKTVAYQDLTGSGIETIAHLKENGRIVLMFCAFKGPPQIIRLHGTGEVVEPGDSDFDGLARNFPPNKGMRAIIRVRLNRVSDSCGYAVPLYDFKAPRDVLDKWVEEKGDGGLKEYRETKNQKSIDDLPGLS